ncbi:NAD(P)-dependent oxidoreductase [Azospirillum brasilense]|uniref:NAD(P)-dependent oxidoreductase n=1 Tax=Azospirillum brasilense TaxID=192 RepID=UPI000E68BD01|nr:NAD(P)-dependent oxidoreductase [Azospirillum brasilense]NUB24838.1 NAD(P)-binding protein [Azospirillum brasilense]NUB33068.1 NAD(P)-binding protein [Azospirillum brasilense]RIW04615.1 NAD(P)-dependent oxidoreductase [Azospirillum brasilense]
MANQRMLGFVHTAQRMPDKRPAAERRQDFAEIYARFSDERANEQANRCSQCGVPFCQVHCPVSNNIPDWLKLTSEGRLEEAYEVSQATNNFPEICGRICPQDRLCEGNCVIEQSTHGAVTIGSVEKYINDTAWDQGWVKPRTPSRELGLSVGVIGAGPAGLAAAEELRAKGYEVHVYDRYDRMGGLLVYGIPGFKLEKSVVERRVKLLADAGVIYHPNFEVGRDASLPELRRKHVAVLVATGVYKARDIKAPGSGLGNIVAALDYLTTSNKVSLGDTVEAYENGSLNAAGKHVVVLGGGDTAMDCVRTAIRQGATSVKCLYRRDRKNMPGSQREVAHAEEEGVEFIWQAAPEGFTGDSVVTGVRAVRIHLGVADATGRQTPQVIEGSEFTVQADLVIKALGFEPEDLPNAFDEPELKVTRWGTLLVDHRTKMTNMDGVFAAGDIVRGASLVVWAIRDGRDAAEGIHAYAKAKAEAPVAVAAE